MKLPILNASEIIKTLKRLGFKEIRQKGSHKYFKHEDGRGTVISVHKGEDISKGLMRKILRDIELSVEEFEEVRRTK